MTTAHPMKLTLRPLCGVIALLFICTGSLRAQGVWTGATDNEWFTDSNWDSNSTPGAGNNVRIDNGNVGISGAASAHFIFMGSNPGDGAFLTIQGGGTLNSNQSFVGYTAG